VRVRLRRGRGEGKNGRAGSLSYCGARDKHYPDRKPMGYPFDRITKAEPELWFKDFITVTRDPKVVDPERIGNMMAVEIKIKHMTGMDPEIGPTIKNFKPLFRAGIMNSGSIVPADPVDCPKGQAIYDRVCMLLVTFTY
jgi:hypothetical protein